jgi:hypothetical protein
VGQTWQWPLAYHLGLAEHLPEEIPKALADGEEVEAGVFFRFEDFVENCAEAAPKSGGGGHKQSDENQFLGKGEVLRFSQSCIQQEHKRTKPEMQSNNT